MFAPVAVSILYNDTPLGCISVHTEGKLNLYANKQTLMILIEWTNWSRISEHFQKNNLLVMHHLPVQ